MMEKNKSINKNHSLFAYFFLFAMLFVSNSYAQKDELFNSAIKTVVIDAGHGGKDPGCNGAHSNEKTVCLNIALALGDMIKKNYPEIKVIYTRDKDVFVELDERARIANKNKADLFICIHANSASPAAYGAETYVLGLHKAESQQKIADRENASIYLEADKGEKYKDFDLSPDAIIARQLQLSIFLDHAISYATKLQREFKSLGRHDRGVKQAGFLVLYKTTMPSVLIETGFLTNPAEENFLAAKDNQQKMAEAMFNAFKKYKAELEGIYMDPTQTTKPSTSTPANTTTNSTTTKNPSTTSPTTAPKTTEQPAKSQSTYNSTTTVDTPAEDEQDKVVFKVQIQTSGKRIPTTSSEFKGLAIFEYLQDGIYKYTTGNFVNNLKDANKLKDELRSGSFPHAFVVAFLNGERITLEKAMKLAEKK